MIEVTRIVAPHAEGQRVRITTAQFSRMCDVGVFYDDEWKIELADGELERRPPPQLTHSLLQSMIFAQLIAIYGVGRVLVEVGVDVSDDTVLGGDIAVLHAPVDRAGWLRPEEVLLMIEVAETTRKRDLGMKRGKYAAAAIAHYWVVDGKHAIVHRHASPDDGDYTDVHTVHFGKPLPVPGTDATITLS
jgi:Uma2 family endonuclease